MYKYFYLIVFISLAVISCSDYKNLTGDGDPYYGEPTLYNHSPDFGDVTTDTTEIRTYKLWPKYKEYDKKNEYKAFFTIKNISLSDEINFSCTYEYQVEYINNWSTDYWYDIIISFTPINEGNKSCDITIYFEEDDVKPYTFTTTGTGLNKH